MIFIELFQLFKNRLINAKKNMEPAPTWYSLPLIGIALLLFLMYFNTEGLGMALNYGISPFLFTALLCFLAGIYIIFNNLKIINSKNFLSQIFGAILYLSMIFSVLAIFHVIAYQDLFIRKIIDFQTLFLLIIIVLFDIWVAFSIILSFFPKIEK